MAKVICTLPNASELINGIRYFKHRLGVISEGIDDKTAKGLALATVRGYFIHNPRCRTMVYQIPAQREDTT
jgi:hypothetical protein